MAFNTVPIHGKLTRLAKNNVAVEFEGGWNLNVQVDTTETNRKGQNWKELISGQAGFSGDASLQFVPGNTEQKALIDNIIAATPGALLTDIDFLLDTSSNAFVPSTGVILTSMAVAAPVGDKVSVSFNFAGTGALTVVPNHT